MGVVVGERSPESFFDGFPDGLSLYRAVEQSIRDIGDVAVVVSRSQIAFKRRKNFAYVWRPAQYVKSDASAVLSIALPFAVASVRFKSVVHPSGRVWMHHLELRRGSDIDEEVRGWLLEAYERAN